MIGLCAFNYRFNAFYGDDLIPFAKQLGQVLVETGRRTNRTDVENAMHFRSKKQMMDNIHAMWKVCDDIVADRKANPRPEIDDILNVMLTATDPVTGKGFTDENIRYQMATFLVAGHDTSAGTMMFLFYNLLQHPEALQKCYAEIDAVVGDAPLTMEHLPKLKYVEACLRETLRFQGPITAVSRHAKKTRLLAGKYRVTPEDAIVINFKGLHHDPAVWGSDCDEFRPERFLNGGWEKLPANCWRPFGTGIRSCIGRYLAEQEIIMALTTVLQRFVVEMAEPDYQLQLKSTLTVKPDGFDIKVRRRPGKDHLFTFSGGAAPASAPLSALKSSAKQSEETTRVNTTGLKPISVFYGGNTGTCKSFGEDIETSAPAFGLHVPARVQSLDSAVEGLPTDRPVILIASSYEGLPPDNARNFVAWLEERAKDPLNSSLLDGVKYTVFGVGNKDWTTTYFRIPKLVDELMGKLGATRLVAPGFCDVSEDVVGPFEEWKTGLLFPALREATGATVEVKTADISVDITQPDTPSQLAGEAVSEGVVTANCVLAHKGVGSEKRQVDILLPPGVEYRSGDYLVVQPFNPRESVARVLRRFGLHADDVVHVFNTTKGHLLTGDTISAWDFLSTRVELANPVSQRQVATLASLSSGLDASRLQTLGSDSVYPTEVLLKRFSLLDLLEDFPSANLSFAQYLDMLPPLGPRQYSISSSPLFSSDQTQLTASLTYDVHSSPSLSHPTTQTFSGVASSFLSQLRPGARLRCFVRETKLPFRLPKDPKAPVIMIATGTGIAPMRAFIQDRDAILNASLSATSPEEWASNPLGPALLYYGIRDHTQDFLYAADLRRWEEKGVISLRPAFSRNPPAGIPAKRVNDLLWEDRDELKRLFNEEGARVLVCGSAAGVGRSVDDVCKRIWRDGHPERGDEESEAWLRGVKGERVVSDVF